MFHTACSIFKLQCKIIPIALFSTQIYLKMYLFSLDMIYNWKLWNLIYACFYKTDLNCQHATDVTFLQTSRLSASHLQLLLFSILIFYICIVHLSEENLLSTNSAAFEKLQGSDAGLNRLIFASGLSECAGSKQVL